MPILLEKLRIFELKHEDHRSSSAFVMWLNMRKYRGLLAREEEEGGDGARQGGRTKMRKEAEKRKNKQHADQSSRRA